MRQHEYLKGACGQRPHTYVSFLKSQIIVNVGSLPRPGWGYRGSLWIRYHDERRRHGSGRRGPWKLPKRVMGTVGRTGSIKMAKRCLALPQFARRIGPSALEFVCPFVRSRALGYGYVSPDARSQGHIQRGEISMSCSGQRLLSAFSGPSFIVSRWAAKRTLTRFRRTLRPPHVLLSGLQMSRSCELSSFPATLLALAFDSAKSALHIDGA